MQEAQAEQKKPEAPARAEPQQASTDQVKLQESSAAPEKPKESEQPSEAEKPKEPEKPAEPAQSKEDEQVKDAPSTAFEPQQTKIDEMLPRESEEPKKPSSDEPQASGALQTESSAQRNEQPQAQETTAPRPSAPSGSESKPEPQQQSAFNESKFEQSQQSQESKPEPSQAPQPEAKPEQNNDSQVEKQTHQPSVTDYEKPSSSGAEQNKAQEAASEAKPEATQSESQPATNGDAIEPKAREDEAPSSILEKGIVYFFFRARVNISDPQDVNDIARSYMILRPLPHGAKLNEGPIPDAGNCRLIAIPKKVLPLSGADRFMVFVESAKTSFADLKSSFLAANDYATRTQGTSHSPPATPIAEGVYAITTTGKDNHFAYMTTIPSQLGEVQKDVGIKDQASFVVSAKNPKYPGPANAQLDNPPQYPQNIIDEFRDLRWMPLKPELLDYQHTQFLLIGESKGIDNALEQLPRDEKKGLEAPKEEMEKLEGEDELRVKHLKGRFQETVTRGIDGTC